MWVAPGSIYVGIVQTLSHKKPKCKAGRTGIDHVHQKWMVDGVASLRDQDALSKRCQLYEVQNNVASYLAYYL
eukprot:scaffold4930_cov72-Skeletonema_dohrnii-CCMP3373.AAC.1